MYGTLNCVRKHFVCYSLQALRTEEMLKRHVKDCFKVNGKQMIKMPKKGEYGRFNHYERKIKSPFIIYADFECILVLEDDQKQNPDESYASKYQKHVVCSYGYKLVCVDDKFRKSFKSYLGEDAAYNAITSTIQER